MFRNLSRSIVAGVTGVALLASGSVALAADTYQVDPEHSTLIFRVKHLGAGWAYGRINQPTGSVTIDGQNPANSTFQIEADAAKIDTANAKRDDHLRGPDFFSAKQFPKLSFKSTGVSKAGDDKYAVAGDLTIRGVTRPVTVELQHVGTVDDRGGGKRTGFEGTFTIKRSDFGVNYMPEGLGDEVRVIVSFEATRR